MNKKLIRLMLLSLVFNTIAAEPDKQSYKKVVSFDVGAIAPKNAAFGDSEQIGVGGAFGLMFPFLNEGNPYQGFLIQPMVSVQYFGESKIGPLLPNFTVSPRVDVEYSATVMGAFVGAQVSAHILTKEKTPENKENTIDFSARAGASLMSLLRFGVTYTFLPEQSKKEKLAGFLEIRYAW